MSLISRRDVLMTAISASVVAAWPAVAAAPTYLRLPEKIPALEGTLCKLFAYDCPFCFRAERQIDAKLFERVQKAGLKIAALSMPARGRYGLVATQFLSAMQVADEQKGIALTDSASRFKAVKDALYWAYHRQGERWSSGEAAIIDVMQKASRLDQSEINDLMLHPATAQKMHQSLLAQEAGKAYGIPAYLVNGQYLIVMKSMKTLDDFYSAVMQAASLK